MTGKLNFEKGLNKLITGKISYLNNKFTKLAPYDHRCSVNACITTYKA